jgi:hypothetical protein
MTFVCEVCCIVEKNHECLGLVHGFQNFPMKRAQTRIVNRSTHSMPSDETNEVEKKEVKTRSSEGQPSQDDIVKANHARAVQFVNNHTACVLAQYWTTVQTKLQAADIVLTGDFPTLDEFPAPRRQELETVLGPHIVNRATVYADGLLAYASRTRHYQVQDCGLVWSFTDEPIRLNLTFGDAGEWIHDDESDSATGSPDSPQQQQQQSSEQ